MLRSPISVFAVAFGLATVCLTGFAYVATPTKPAVYVTWEGIGPDKWASIWLIRRHLNPSAEIRRVPVNADTSGAIAFDIPGSQFIRNAKSTTFAQMVAEYVPGDHPKRQSIAKMADMIDEMEISRWGIVNGTDTDMLEEGYRNIQMSYDRESVPFACYLAYFDRVEDLLTADQKLDRSITAPELEACALSSETGASIDQVPEINTKEVLKRINSGEKIVFVDTREPAEFEEFRIPGAIHIPLREIADHPVSSLADADLVIPYCVKDFRGYEVARALSRRGIRDVAIMNPYGIRGWMKKGLPIAGQRGSDDPVALDELRTCAKDGNCLN